MSAADVIRMLAEDPESIPKKERLEMRRLLDLDEGGVHDLVGANLRRLREENRDIRARLSRMQGTARGNERLLEFIFDATVAVIGARSAKGIAAAVRKCAKARGIADGFHLLDRRRLSAATRGAPGRAQDLYRKLIVGEGLPPGLGKVVGRGGGKVRSHVGFPVGSGKRTLAFALFVSHEDDHFNSGGHGDFLSRFEEVLRAKLAALGDAAWEDGG